MILEHHNQCGQSEEMIQTGAAEDRSALGSPSCQDPQPYSVIDSVTGLRTFPCENCDKQFTDPSNLQRHIRSQHVGARSHACPECGKTFATSSGLKQHQHIHSSVKPFQCEVCLKAYTQFSNLCRHKRMHADCRQQIKCKDCGQAFSTMTSLSKHKRFCEGMLRPNGQQRISYPGLGSPANEKTPSLGLMNAAAAAAAAQSPTSALASYMQSMYQQPHRPPFPFYPPAFSGAGFPLFPGSGHPMAGGLAPTMAGVDGKLGSLGGTPGGKSPGSPGAGSLHGQTGEMKREKNASEGSEVDSSDVSSASDLDTSTGSDMDSEYHHGSLRHHRKIRARLHGSLSGGVQVVNSHTRLGKSPLPISVPPPAAHMTPTSRSETHSPVNEHSEKHEDEDDRPFDLSKTSSPPTPVSNSAGEGDQPLDLSVRTKDVCTTPETTPRKTHIFGGSGSSDGKRTPTPASSSVPMTRPTSSSPETPPSPVPLPMTSTPSSTVDRPLHYAYPTMGTSPVVIEPMYRVDKEKPQSYHDVVARMMAYGPPRLPMHQNPLNFGGLQGGMGMLSPARPDAAKLLPPMLGKTPDHFAYHNTNVNKLKERYACKFCGKIFPRSANLTRHLRTHTGEQPYKCKYCERSFSISSNLQRHVRNIHNKEKPFKCPLCERCFGQQTNLDRHLKKHESDDPNMLDSPVPHEQELEDKDESYFDEIRNFIGKATAEGGEEPRLNGTEGLGHDGMTSGSIANDAGHGIVDSRFSLTGQIVEKHSMPEKRPAPDDEEDDLDDVEDEEDIDMVKGEDSSPSLKKSRLDNNNVPSANKTEFDELPKTTNGHDDEEDLDDDLQDEELDEEEGVSLNGLSDSSSSQINSVKAPMACSS